MARAAGAYGRGADASADLGLNGGPLPAVLVGLNPQRAERGMPPLGLHVVQRPARFLASSGYAARSYRAGRALKATPFTKRCSSE
jgi:hypothetical protein